MIDFNIKTGILAIIIACFKYIWLYSRKIKKQSEQSAKPLFSGSNPLVASKKM